ncbi:MAG: hypothetical protein HC913_00840 [Microscillaceae bacterium]|nr:hypothetical protein [Microscillaceae bacterium]NJO93068.1 hypothetical protein [Chloroflexia bacterium]
MKLQFGFLIAIIVLAAFSRIIPHMPNFSPLGAIGLFGAAHFDKKWKAFLIPIAATWLSDLFINNVIYAQYYPQFTWFYEGFYWQYGSYLLITFAGLIIFNKISVSKVLLGGLASTTIFFTVSNFGCWLGSTFYPQNFTGLTACYVAGIPFLTGTLLGDLFYSVVLFGGYYLLQSKISFFKLDNVRYA